MHVILPAVLFALTSQVVPYTLERLELNVAVDYEHQRVEGVARLTIRNTSRESVQAVPLLLGRLMTVRGAGGLSYEQSIVTFDDEGMRQVDFTSVHLSKPLLPGESTTVSLDYGGYIVGYTETGELYVKDRVADDFSIIREDAYAFPVLGVPSRTIDRKIARNGFSFDAHVTVPDGFIVACGGLVDQKESNGKTTFHFASNERVPFVNLSIAKFCVLDEDGVKVYSLPADEAGAKLVLQRTLATLALFTKSFGPLQQAPKFSIIEIPEGWGSQANLIAGIILTADAFKDPKWLFELYHELGHLWNPPDLDKPSPRLTEGQSMWLQWVTAEELDGLTAERVEKITTRTIDRISNEPRLRTTPLASYGSTDMTDWSYTVGYLYFTLLEKVIGREALLRVLGDFYQANKNRGATLEDFTKLLEQRFPKTAAVDADWITSTKWLQKLEDAHSIEALARTYTE